jgi:hypothetical protein
MQYVAKGAVISTQGMSLECVQERETRETRESERERREGERERKRREARD